MAFRLCEHIKTDGIRCHSPAMRERKYCHYHTLYRKRGKVAKGTPGALREPFIDAKGHWLDLEVREPAAKRYVLGALEDGPALQVAISTVVNALADNRLDIGRASTLLYGLQLASTNLRNLHPDDAATAPGPDAETTVTAPGPQPGTAPTPAPEPAATSPAEDASPATHCAAGTYAEVPEQEELVAIEQTKKQRNEELTRLIWGEGGIPPNDPLAQL